MSDVPSTLPMTTTPAGLLAGSDRSALTTLPVSLSQFSYTAQTDEGFRISGVVEAPNGAAAVQILQAMRLRIIDLSPVNAGVRPSPIRGSEFLAFNQQLAECARAGIPIETAILRAAASMRRGKFARAVAAIAREVESGVTAADAFENHREQFPPLYARLIDVGVRGGNLHGVLLTLAPRLDMQQRLSAILWRSVAYPLMTLCALLVVISFIGWQVMPRMQTMFVEMRLEIPPVTEAAVWMGQAAPYAAAGILSLWVLAVMVWGIVRFAGAGGAFTDRLLVLLPLVGPAVRFGLISRWIAALRVGIAANLELPEAIRLAGDATGSPLLQRDGEMWASVLAGDVALETVHFRLLPETVPAAVRYSAGRCSLPDALQTLSDLYERLAELRIERIPAIVTPFLTILVALLFGLMALGVSAPLILYMQELTRQIRVI